MALKGKHPSLPFRGRLPSFPSPATLYPVVGPASTRLPFHSRSGNSALRTGDPLSRPKKVPDLQNSTNSRHLMVTCHSFKIHLSHCQQAHYKKVQNSGHEYYLLIQCRERLLRMQFEIANQLVSSAVCQNDARQAHLSAKRHPLHLRLLLQEHILRRIQAV